MKIRVTVMTENDKHVNTSKEEIEEKAKIAWQMIFDLMSKESGDKAIVESCELVEN